MSGAAALTAARLALRTVRAEDAAELVAIMNACVLGSDAFHGPCSEWALDWAVDFSSTR